MAAVTSSPRVTAHPAVSTGFDRTGLSLNIRTRGKTWQVNVSAIVGEFVPVEVFGRHKDKFYCRLEDIDSSKRERVRLFKPRDIERPAAKKGSKRIRRAGA